MRYTGSGSVSSQQTLRAEPFIPAAATSQPWPLQLMWEDSGVGKHSEVGVHSSRFPACPLPIPAPCPAGASSHRLLLSGS